MSKRFRWDHRLQIQNLFMVFKFLSCGSLNTLSYDSYSLLNMSCAGKGACFRPAARRMCVSVCSVLRARFSCCMWSNGVFFSMQHEQQTVGANSTASIFLIDFILFSIG